MSRRMSCGLTVDAVRARRKTVTRRAADTWRHLKAGDRLTLVEKAQGLGLGEHQVVLAEVEVVDVRVEPLARGANWAEIMAEGLWDRASLMLDGRGKTPGEWFCEFWLESHGHRPDADPRLVMVRRIEWRYLDDEALAG